MSKIPYNQIMAQQTKQRRRPRDIEHSLQCGCITWFLFSHSELRFNLFAVPNGGRRDVVTGAKLKAEGVLAGVSDLILLVPNRHFHALCIEMKTPNGYQSESQKIWQRCVERQGYKYVVCRSVEDFKNEINSYLNDVA